MLVLALRVLQEDATTFCLDSKLRSSNPVIHLQVQQMAERQVEMADLFVYFGIMTVASCISRGEVRRRIGIARSIGIKLEK